MNSGFQAPGGPSLARGSPMALERRRPSGLWSAVRPARSTRRETLWSMRLPPTTLSGSSLCGSMFSDPEPHNPAVSYTPDAQRYFISVPKHLNKERIGDGSGPGNRDRTTLRARVGSVGAPKADHLTVKRARRRACLSSHHANASFATNLPLARLWSERACGS